ncbi:hypothetical protein DMP06_00060 [Slackia equolifaciens]|uniref:Uncharacterized protein n=1 Tax=Slackia equolifaciens TaxID=498718 RepID=A0A3N0B544_9ACTN|nr:hypothetical protein [Slackia equolifaciens]RNL41849.1 hypothetical protein DMP06_00060 [Slackia equolifaciens]
MGNRAVITTEKRDLGVYLHWNGGRDSVEAFLRYCELRGFRSPDSDEYGWARLCQVIANFMGASGLSVGISRYTTDKQMDPGDNGVYVIRGWEIVDRVYPYTPFEEEREYPLDAMLREIDASQPEDQRLGAYLDAEEVPTASVRVGDVVYVRRVDGTYGAFPVVGVGDGRVVNGLDTIGVPYVAMYAEYGPAEENCNNYLSTPTVSHMPK